jgi:hypothetical protein
MYTIENNFAEMVQVAKEKGINTKGMNKATLINALNALEPAVVVEETPIKGRKINLQSARQIRLAEMEARRVDGEIKRGRPVNPTSPWFVRQAELTAKREVGELKLGRAINPNSARQIRLAKKGTLPLGRPKSTKIEEVPTDEVVVEDEVDVEIEEVFVG